MTEILNTGPFHKMKLKEYRLFLELDSLDKISEFPGLEIPPQDCPHWLCSSTLLRQNLCQAHSQK